jgi:4-amino-4-deoxy-L-arabinose transferase-like glycosyltransferase
MKNIFEKTWFWMVLFCITAYFPIFLNLEFFPIRIWDEARLAMNSWEMLMNKNYLVSYFGNSPDMWNTKPPMMLWAQVVFSKLLGPGELAVRLPSAISALLTAFLIIIIGWKYLRNIKLGYVMMFVLITSSGYISMHGTRTGDYDSLLTFWTTCFLFSFFYYIHTENKRYLIITAFLMALAVLTKSIQGMIFLVPMVIYYFYEVKSLRIFSKKYFYGSVLLFLIPVLLFYFAREHFNPGFLKAVWENELGGRYGKTLENHDHPFSLYFDRIRTVDFWYWYLFVPIGIFFGVLSPDRNLKKLTIFSTMCAFFYLLIISNSKTKLTWYNIPAFPFLSILAGIGFYYLFAHLNDFIFNKFKIRYVGVVLACIILFFPYYKIFNEVYRPTESNIEGYNYNLSYFLKNCHENKSKFENATLFYKGHENGQINYYVQLLNAQGKNIRYIKEQTELKKGDQVVASEEDAKREIEGRFNFTVERDMDWVKTYQLLDPK